MLSTAESVIMLLQLAINMQIRIENSLSTRKNRKSKEDSTQKLIYEYFVILSQLLLSLDEKVFITREVEDQLALLTVARELHSLFYCHVLKLNDAPPLEWRDQTLQANGSKWDGCIKLSSQLIHFGRFELHKQRQEYGRIVEMQKMLREMGASGREPSEELQLDLPEGESVGDVVLDIDAACIIVQTWERVYQSIARYSYLKEVRQKAADLHMAEKPIDPLKAIVMIQARTRGLFTRKAVNEMRYAELNVLGMSIESLLRSYIDARAPSPRNIGSVIVSEEQLKNLRTSLAEVLNDMHETYFSRAPEFYKTYKISKRKDEKRENMYHDLLIASIIKHRPNTEIISLNDLISYDVSAKIGKSEIIFDIRDIIYCTTVIPHMLMPWRVASVIRRPLLLIGEEKAGKTAWCCAIAKQCAAAHICISAKNFAIKGAKKLKHAIEQFAKRDGYCVIEIDRLEMFTSSKRRKSTQKTVLCSLLEELKQIDAQVIGSSRSIDIDEDIAAFFPNIIRLSNPDGFARFQLICDRLSRRLESERLPKIPPRLTDFCKVTRRMNCGATVARVIASTAK